MLLLPTLTFPKLRLVGVALSDEICVTPVPESETVAGELVAVLTTETLPAALPAAVGAKVTLKVALRRAARLRGSESPLMLNPAPVTDACETVTLCVPLFLSVTVSVLRLPTVTVPKLRLVGFALSTLLAAASSAVQNTAVKRKTGNKNLVQLVARRRLARHLK